MAKKKGEIKMTADDLETWKKGSEDSVIDPQDEELDNVFADFPQNDACIELFRTSKVGGRPVFLEQITPAMFALSYVADKFGGGVYIARARYKDGSRVRMPFEIEGEPFHAKRTIPNPAMAPMQQAPAHEPIIYEGDSNALVPVLNMMLKQMQQSETQILEKMKLYKDLFGAGGKSETPLDTALNMFQKGLEMASLNGGEGLNPWLMVARELKEPLSKIVDTVQVALSRPAQPSPYSQHPQPVPATQPVAPAAQQTAVPDAQLGTFIRMVLPALVNAASKNTDPTLYTDFILDQVPEAAYTQLREWLLQEDCLDTLAAIEPGIKFQRDWWIALRGNLLVALNEPQEPSNGDSSIQSAEDTVVTAVPTAARNTAH